MATRIVNALGLQLGLNVASAGINTGFPPLNPSLVWPEGWGSHEGLVL